jgi:hypothetical protein
MARWGQLFGGPRVWVRDIVFTAGCALTVSLLGPYGSYGAPIEDRLVTSFAYGFIAGIWIWPLMRLLLRIGARAGLPELFTIVTGLAVLTLPIGLISQAIYGLLHPGSTGAEPVQLYLAVLAMVLPIGTAYLLVDRRLERAGAPIAPDPKAPPKLFARLPAHLGRDVVALQAEDHYVRVHTLAGSTLLLMRLADAIHELDGLDGLRVHRSWWVARSAVEAARPEGRRAALSLKGGLTVPVTRDAVPEIRRAGWL